MTFGAQISIKYAQLKVMTFGAQSIEYAPLKVMTFGAQTESQILSHFYRVRTIKGDDIWCTNRSSDTKSRVIYRFYVQSLSHKEHK